MIQPAQVLPSNGSPILNVEHDRSSRVLREQSNNRQHNEFPYADVSEQKYSSLLLAENSYSGQPQPRPQHYYRQTPLQRNLHRRSSPAYQLYHNNHDARVKVKIATDLYKRFQASDQYMKYRSRQHKEGKNGEHDQKWPDHLEVAFFEALVWWPPMGRRQIQYKDKRRGRNELIADHIEELTGESRTRKQVSSHIQVLKPFVEHDPNIMRWMSKDDFGAMGPTGRMMGSRAASYHHGRRASCYPVTAPVQTHAPPVPTMAPAVSYDLSEVKGHLAVFEPIEFQMFVQRKTDKGYDEQLHHYTQSVSRPRQADEKLDDWTTFSRDYPFAASLLCQQKPDCNIVLAEASLACHNGKSLSGVELGISFLCRSRFLPAEADVHCRNTFYKSGQLLAEHTSTNKVDLSPSAEIGGVETQLRFGSAFWAKQMAYAGTRLRDETGVEEVRDHLRKISAYQEIFLNTEHGSERLLVICWSFRLSNDVRGKAYWRRLRLPPDEVAKTERVDSVYDYNVDYSSSMPQPALQSPFEYDTSSGGSALPWAADLEDQQQAPAPYSAVDFPTDTNAFDFSDGNIHLSYPDPALLDFSNFDSSAFTFDPQIANSGAAEYTNYSTATSAEESQAIHGQDFSSSLHHIPEYDSQWYAAFDQQGATATYAAGGADSQQVTQVFDEYAVAAAPYDHTYAPEVTEGQAYEGAPQQSGHQDSLSALASATYLATSESLPSGQVEQHQTP